MHSVRLCFAPALLSDTRDLPTFCFRALSALNFGLGRRRNGIKGTLENALQTPMVVVIAPEMPT